MAIIATIQVEGAASITCHAWNGYITWRQNVPDVYHRLGGEYSGVQILGRRAKPTRCTAIVLCADAAAAESAAATLNNMRGLYVVVNTGVGTSLRCLVHDANGIVVAASHGYGGIMYPFRAECELTLECVGQPT